MYIYIYMYIYIILFMVFTTKVFLEVALESWPGSNQLIYQAMSSTRSQSQLCTATPISIYIYSRKKHSTFILIKTFRLLPLSIDVNIIYILLLTFLYINSIHMTVFNIN